MRMKDRFYLIVLVVLFVNLFISFRNSEMSRQYQKLVSEGVPYRFVDERSGIRELTDFCVEGDRLYLLFGDAAYVKIYDLEGNYSHSYAFASLNNGIAELYTGAGLVWLESKDGDVYTFSDGEFVTCYPLHSEDYPKDLYLWNMGKQTDAGGRRYEKRWASIVRTAPDGTVQIVVPRPFFLVLFEEKVVFAIHFLGFAFLAYYVLSERRRRQKAAAGEQKSQ